MNMYYIKEGEITEVSHLQGDDMKALSDTIDWQESILVYCKTPERAIELAVCFDAGLVQEDSLFWPDSYGKGVVAICDQ